MRTLCAFALATSAVCVLAGPVHAAYINGSTYDMNLRYNSGGVETWNWTPLMLYDVGSPGPPGYLDGNFQVWSVDSVVHSPPNVDHVTISVRRSNNSPMNADQLVRIVIDNLYQTGHSAGDPGVALDVTSLSIEFTQAVPPSFPGPPIAAPFTDTWAPATGLVLTMGDLAPITQPGIVPGSEVTGLKLTFDVVPEPYSWVMLTGGAVCLIRRRRTR